VIKMGRRRSLSKISQSFSIETIVESSEKNLVMVKSLKLTGHYPTDNGFWAITNRWNSIIQERYKAVKDRSILLSANKPFRLITNLLREIIQIRRVKKKWKSLWLLNQVYDLFWEYYNIHVLFVNTEVLDEIITILELFKAINIWIDSNSLRLYEN